MKVHIPSKMMKCHLCDFKNKRSTKMHVHMQDDHEYADLEQAYADSFCGGVKQTCSCGCGSNLKWESWFVGYPKKRVAGHNNAPIGKPCIPKVASTDVHDCPWCDFSGTRLALRTHTLSHGKNAQETYDAIFLKDQPRPTCACGCEEELRFCGIEKGYPGIVNQGHNARTDNNFKGSNPEERNKNVSEGRKKSFQEGNFFVWNDGETKESDFRIAAYGEKGSQTILSNPEELERRSKLLSENRLNGTVQTLYGPEHSQWNGGYSKLAALAHSYLYKSWKLPKLEAAGFKCSRCPSCGSLHVHHDDERFCDILREASAELNYQGEEDFEIKSAVARRIEQIHLERNISGLVLCAKCHDAEHERLGESFNILKRVI